jgi:hypothetical protein
MKSNFEVPSSITFINSTAPQTTTTVSWPFEFFDGYHICLCSRGQQGRYEERKNQGAVPEQSRVLKSKVFDAFGTHIFKPFVQRISPISLKHETLSLAANYSYWSQP